MGFWLQWVKTSGSDGRRREKYTALQSRLKQRRIVNDSGSKEARLYHQNTFNLQRKKEPFAYHPQGQLLMPAITLSRG